jgi:hypothetical protein
VVFLLIAIGFTGENSATIAKWVFGIFLLRFIGALVIGLTISSRG